MGALPGFLQDHQLEVIVQLEMVDDVSYVAQTRRLHLAAK
jgi:hypothetical protein